MSLTVDSKNIPVGILAIIAFGKLNITVEASSETVFQVESVKLNTVPSVVRYLIRAYQLFNESTKENQVLASILDAALSEKLDILKARVQNSSAFLSGGSEPSVVDYIVWAALREVKDLEYVKAVEATSVAQEAIKKASELSASTTTTTAGSNEIPMIPGTGSDPSTNPIDAFKNFITVQIAAIGKIDPVVVYNALDNPRAVENGDLAIALPRLRVKGNPAAIAKEWAAAFVPNDYIIEASAAGPFLNFRFNKALLMKMTLNLVSKMGEHYGDNTSGNGKTVIVEFSSPNIAKPFHAGHLRSTIIGAFVRNIYHANGWKTITMNYLGDWGKQYGK